MRRCTLPELETVALRRGASNGAELRIVLNRPGAHERVGRPARARPARGRGARGGGRRGPRRDDHRRGARLLARAPTCARASSARRTATRTSGGALRERYNPIIAGDPPDAQAGARGRQRPGGRHRVLARARLRPRDRARVGLPAARLREHRPRARRRRRRCSCRPAPAWAGAAEMALLGRARPGAAGAGVGARDRASTPTTRSRPRSTRSPSGSPRDRRAPTRGPSAQLNAAAVRAARRAARARGRDPAGAGRARATSAEGVERLRGEARRQVLRRVSRPARSRNTLRSPNGPPAPLRVLRRAVAPAVLALLVVAATASRGLHRTRGGRLAERRQTRTLYWLIFSLGVVVFVGVEGVLIWCMVKFRAKKGRVAAQIHGNTRLEIGWTVGAACLLDLPHGRDLRDAAEHQEPGALGDRRERQPGRPLERRVRRHGPAAAARAARR